ncbi:MAG: hypothetical protein AB1758_20050, partial [Candidatus Eremiobacterota bacterium]
MTRTLVSFDIASIKQFVFATDRLREIRGASGLLDRLNRVDLPKVAERVDHQARLIFSGGGTGLVLVSSQAAQNVCAELERTFAEATVHGRLNTAHIEVPQQGGDYGALYSTLAARLRIAKQIPPDFVCSPTHPLMMPCGLCGDHYATTWSKDPDGQELPTCGACEAKLNYDRMLRRQLGEGKWPGFWEDLDSAARSKGGGLAGCKRPEDLAQIVEDSGEELALIYADGDGLGRLLAEARTLEDLQKRSQAVEQSLFAALAQALGGPLRPRDGRLPFDVFLIGGDDLVLATRASKAFSTAELLASQFHAHSGELLGWPASLSIGIAMAHARYPFRHLLELGEGALKQAKRERFLAQRDGNFPKDGPGWISYVRVSGSSFHSFEDYESNELLAIEDGKPVRRSLRPFTPSFLRTIQSAARELAPVARTKLE